MQGLRLVNQGARRLNSPAETIGRGDSFYIMIRKHFAIGEAYCNCKSSRACPNRVIGNEHEGRFVPLVSRFGLRRAR
jgi:hypothetical protein